MHKLNNLYYLSLAPATHVRLNALCLSWLVVHWFTEAAPVHQCHLAHQKQMGIGTTVVAAAYDSSGKLVAEREPMAGAGPDIITKSPFPGQTHAARKAFEFLNHYSAHVRAA